MNWRVGALLEEMLPGVPYTLSHQLMPILREYRRASATAIDASLKPLMQRHLREMAADLRAAGFARRPAGQHLRRRLPGRWRSWSRGPSTR